MMNEVLCPIDWKNPDSNGDGYKDGVGIRNGTDSTIKYSHPGYVFMFYMDVDNNIGENLNLQKEIDEFRDINGIGGKVWVTALYDNYGGD